MTLLKQNSKLIASENLNLRGSKFFCLLAIAQIHARKELNPQQIMDIYGRYNGVVVTNSEEDLPLYSIFYEMGEKMDGSCCGYRESNKNLDFNGNEIKSNTNNIYTVIRYIDSDYNYHHVVGDLNGIEIYDPNDYSIRKMNMSRKIDKIFVYKIDPLDNLKGE
jgi:hypothetical protein